MIGRLFRSGVLIPALIIFAGLLYWKLHSGPPKAISIGYIGDRDATVWNTLAQVRQPAAELHYGERIEVLKLDGAAAQVRTASGTVGWLQDARQIMDSDLWSKSAALAEKTAGLPVQSRGRTKTVSNVRVEPGRDGRRVFQFPRGTPVVILQRAVADAPQGPDDASQDAKEGSDSTQKPKQEDWLLVMRATENAAALPAGGSPARSSKGPEKPKPTTSDAVSGGPLAVVAAEATPAASAGPVAGWVLARFIEPDLPDTVKDYASSADLHVVAWFELNRVPDGSGGQAPQYLVAGSHGGEGQACDFTMLRVYTWNTARKRYETAYVESNLCGQLPIRVSSGAKGPEFQFPDVEEAGAPRMYSMNLTSVRRVKSAAPSPATTRK